MMDVFRFFTAASLLCAVFSLPERGIIFVNELKNWTEAQSFCREKFTDLVTISSLEESTNLTGMVDLNTMVYLNTDNKNRAWIGLFDDVDSWMWSITDSNFYQDGEAEFRNWALGEPNNYQGVESCVEMWDKGLWNDAHCGVFNKAVCYDAQVSGQNDSFIFINQSMTWTEAQSYCREHHTDLASVRNTSDCELIKELIQSAAENAVWIGLYRNSWTWVEGSRFPFRHWRTSEPNGAQENCAAAAMDDGLWEDWLCDSKMPFFCHAVPVSKQVVKVKLATTTSLDLSDPAVLEELLKQFEQKLRNNRADVKIKLSWRKTSDGKIFH